MKQARQSCGDCGHMMANHQPDCHWRSGDGKLCDCQGGKVGLTRREFQILQLLASGRNKKEVAQDLDLSYKTVAAHCFNIANKTGTHSTLAVILCALNAGLVQLSDLPKFTLPILVQQN